MRSVKECLEISVAAEPILILLQRYEKYILVKMERNLGNIAVKNN